MALDLQKDFERLNTNSAPDEHTLRQEEESEGERREDGRENGCRKWQHDEADGQSQQTTQYGRAKAGFEVIDDTPTPPINVPSPFGEHGNRRFNEGMHESYGYDEASLDGTVSSSKRTSLSFDPLVKLDSGDHIPLEEPVPKLTTSEEGAQPVPQHPRGRSMIDILHKQMGGEQRSISRAHSETDREEYDSETGEKFESEYKSRRDGRFQPNQERWPFLRETVEQLAAERHRLRGRNERPSLTSRTTASPLVDEVRTPDSIPVESAVMSPIEIPSPASRPPNWITPIESPRKLAQSARSRSYGQERRPSRRNGTRRSNSSMSPASAFLSRYSTTTQLPDPDEEGQEVGDYVMGREIGFGGFSLIREAYTFRGPERIQHAVKIVRRQVSGKGELENESLQAEFEHEVSLWRCLHHKHILPLLAVYISDFATFAFMPMNLGGTLFDTVRAHRDNLPARRVRRWAYQVASALRYLHEDMRIVHRDVKLENCLLDTSGPDAAATGGDVLLCDFGLADYLTGPVNQAASSTVSQPNSPDVEREPSFSDRPQTAPNGDAAGAKISKDPAAGKGQQPHHTFGPSDTSTSLAGSLPYAAPELLEAGHGILDPCVDMWAYGVLLFCLIAGKLPFTHSFAPRVRMMILSNEFDRAKLKEREGLDGGRGESGFEGMYEVVNGCMQRWPKKRWDVKDVLESGWLEYEKEIQGDDDDGRQWR